MQGWKRSCRPSDPLKADLQQAHAERSRGDAQQIPALMSELESLRQEYEHCRATYEYERKIFTDHYESLQLMEKKLHVNGGTHGANVGHKDNDVSSHHSVGQPLYEDDNLPNKECAAGAWFFCWHYSIWGRVHLVLHHLHEVGHDAMRGHSFDAPRSANFDGSRGGGGFDTSGGTGGYDSSMVTGYGIHRSASAFEAQRGGSGYDAPKGIGIAPGAGPIGNNVPPYGAPLVPNPYGPVQLPSPYGAGQPPAHMGSGYEVPHGCEC
ncbi:hypothetical protein J5N97_004965 [Dioscorea zingiberensis]|uniref:Uncharacterized protein n=1 Tax=Dioscorea zingiberensis TaxID=325984 RepID=A0A9D5D878_9LILI|nr:hypothetical protein J5N97_004965 [Dioscorea zingiberensis]